MNRYITMLAVMTAICTSCTNGTRQTRTGGDIDLILHTSTQHPPLVALEFGGVKHLFMVDTGSQYSYVDDTSLPEESSQPVGGTESMTVATYDGESTMFATRYKLMSDCGIILNVYATDLTAISRHLFMKSGKNIVGILGNDFLQENRLVVDYSARRLYKSSFGKPMPDSIQTHDTTFSNQQKFDPANPSDGGGLQRAA